MSSLVCLGLLLQDELTLDRAIDVPVYQDVLAWDKVELGTLNRLLPFLARQVKYLYGACIVEVGCGFLADGQT